MKRFFPAFVLGAAALLAQTPRPGAAVDPVEDIPTFKSVEVAGGAITFRMFAPQAKSVQLRGEAVTVSGKDFVPMTRDEKGVWSATIRGLRPETYSYIYVVDGAPTMDQRNPGAKVGPRGNSTRFDMPGSPDFYQYRNVPHGKVEMNWYGSEILKEPRPLWIYTPPGYATSNQSYPVLYLLHGSGDLEAGWAEDGRANFILDNLIADGKALPMIVVLPRGHVIADRQIDREKNNELLEEVLIREIIPYVDSHYRVRAGSANRAIAGLSMGGGQTLRFGLHHPDRFAWVVGFSSAIRYPDETYRTMFANLVADPAKTNKQFKLIMLRCGTKDHLLDASDAFDRFLTANKVRHEYKRTDYESMWPGRRDDHTWPIWRMDLRDVAQVLFR